MKIMTILGTRPEIIRLSTIIPQLDGLSEHILVHTGQNFDKNLNDIFFSQLGLREPDYFFNSRTDYVMEQIGKIIFESEKIILKERPDKLLVLGDTNSGLSAIVAKRMGIPVFHMEAGNRCYDDRVPEETNRRIIDHSSDVLMPYTERSRENLLREGISNNRIYVTGNPIKEVLDNYSGKIDSSGILKKLGLKEKQFFLLTLHRAENVDVPERLESFISALEAIAKEYKMPIICSLHPRTRAQLIKQHKEFDKDQIIALDPLGLFDFVRLEKKAFCVLTDSGTVQEECCIFRIPNVTLRDVTERPETLEAGSNILSGCDKESILRCVKIAVSMKSNYNIPAEYLTDNVSNSVVKILFSHRI